MIPLRRFHRLVAFCIIFVSIVSYLWEITGEYENLTSLSVSSCPTELWLVVCETRSTADLTRWMYTARAVRQIAERDPTVNVKIRNICSGVQWNGFRTKLIALRAFLSEKLIPSLTNVSVTSTVSCPRTNNNTLIVFSDSDAFFNPWAETAKGVIGRFRRAVQGKKLLFSAEPCCWIGSYCHQGVLDDFYPNATRMSCPQFLNSGAYVGYPDTVLELLQSAEVGSCFQKRCDDQHMFTKWYSKNTDIAQLDLESSVFRNVVTGLVDSRRGEHPGSTRDQFTCGPGDAARNCSRFSNPYWGRFNNISMAVEFDELPDWMKCVTEPRPFHVHGTGIASGPRGAKVCAMWMLDDLIAGMEKKFAEKIDGMDEVADDIEITA